MGVRLHDVGKFNLTLIVVGAKFHSIVHANRVILQGVTITLLITGFFGANIWRFTLPYGITAAVGFELLLYLSGIISSHPFIVYRILVSYRKRTGKMRPFTEAIRPLIPFVSMFVITTIWVVFSQNDICANETRILFLLFGTVFSNICVSFLLVFFFFSIYVDSDAVFIFSVD